VFFHPPAVGFLHELDNKAASSFLCGPSFDVVFVVDQGFLTQTAMMSSMGFVEALGEGEAK
jgi:hypothetical protein